MSQPYAKNQKDGERQVTLMAKSTVSDLSKRCGKQDSKYGK